MKLISWNVQGSTKDRRVIVAEQAEALVGAGADIIALQEVTKRRAPEWEDVLGARGWSVRHNRDILGKYKNFELTASRWPIVEVHDSAEFAVPIPSRVLSVTLEVEDHPLQIVNTHVPDGSSYGEWKMHHFEGLYQYLSRTHTPGCPPRILCGDFNEPQSITDEGYVITWAQRPSGELRTDEEHRARWDASVRGVLVGLRAFDLGGVYVDHRPERPDPDWSWMTRNGTGRRYDHILAAAELGLVSCGYEHSWRTDELSDHSAVWAEFNWPADRS